MTAARTHTVQRFAAQLSARIDTRTVASVLLAVLVPALLAAPVQAGDSLTVDDIFGLEYADEPRLAPDGDRIVYVRRTMDAMTDRNRGQLWIIDRDGDRHQPLTSADGHASSPAWSPDGSRIAFIGHDGSGSGQLQVLWLDSGRQTALTRGPLTPSNPVWSPDGERIAFSRFVEAAPPRIVEPLSPPEGADWAPPARVVDRPVFRADGAGFLPHGQTQRFIVPADGGPVRQLTEGPYPQPGPVTWSRDGRALVFATNRRPDFELEPSDTELVRLDLDDLELTTLTDRFGPDNAPAFQPGGERLAWLGYDDERLGYHNVELYVLDDGAPRSLTADLDRSIDAFAWDDDGDALFVSYSDRGNGVIDRVTLDGDRSRVAENLGGTTLGRPYASGTFDAGADRVVYTRTTPAHPGDLVIARSDRRMRRWNSERLTRLNAERLAYRDLAAVEEFTFSSSADGREIQGWLALPPGHDPESDGALPLILEIHGGPFADYGDRFSMEVQLMAAAGYAVAYINPRGSTSYGAEFANEIHHAYPGEDYDDLMSGVDALIERGVADPERLFVTGGSGGGVLTAWIVGSTDRFRAAVVAKPVINWTSFVLTADYTPFFHRYWFPAPPWEAQDEYWRRSPLSRVGNVTTPTMVLTGEADWRTPMWESEQFYQALKLRGIDSVLVRIPEAPHGIAARPSQMASKIRHILAWFERYDTDSERSHDRASEDD
ncbi:alpha/beta hydrolase family protein [Halomonas denitrificans]|nr:S9 family peptidase [Halomonas denitrificans]